jgi:hypothetical protein
MAGEFRGTGSDCLAVFGQGRADGQAPLELGTRGGW